jgi:hypothetical protein
LRKISIIVLIGFCFASCKDKNTLPAGIFDRDKMQAVLGDVLQAESYTNTYLAIDSIKKKDLVLENAKLQHQVFAIHNVTKDEFYTSYDYYRMHPELMAALLDSMQTSYERIQNANNVPVVSRFPNRYFPNQHLPFLKDSLNRSKFNHPGLPKH